MTSIFTENPGLVANSIKMSQADILELAGSIVGSPQSRTSDKKEALKRLDRILFGNFSEEDAKKLVRCICNNGNVQEEMKYMTKTTKALADKVDKALAKAKSKPAKAAKATDGKAAKATDGKAATKVGKEKGTRALGGAFAGKHIYPLHESNPRRIGTHGFKSMAIVHRKPGIAVDEYLKAGGRLVDLRWDIAHKFAEVRDK